jgi:hypothetical protein
LIRERPDDRVDIAAAEHVEKTGGRSLMLATVGAGVASTGVGCGVALIHTNTITQYVSFDK